MPLTLCSLLHEASSVFCHQELFVRKTRMALTLVLAYPLGIAAQPTKTHAVGLSFLPQWGLA